MNDTERFEDKVKEALREVMRHSVSGHGRGVPDPTATMPNARLGYNSFCNEPEHALSILREHGITPMNSAIAERLDKVDL